MTPRHAAVLSLNSSFKKSKFVNLELDSTIKKYGFEAFEVIEVFDVAFSKEELNIKESKIEHQKFEMVDIKFDLERNERTKVSKEMKIGVNKDILELGTKLHELLEIIDFKNPDYSFITNEFYKSKVKKLLESDLLKNVKDGKVFKEYEYFDEEHHGIIDLLIVYSDHIDIIDYKTKNIKDDEYDKQVRIYRDYINKISNLPVNLYLYSIIDSAYIKIK